VSEQWSVISRLWASLGSWFLTLSAMMQWKGWCTGALTAGRAKSSRHETGAGVIAPAPVLVLAGLGLKTLLRDGLRGEGLGSL
jgi:hypothetical protein